MKKPRRIYDHNFIVTVKTVTSRSRAKIALMTSFACRQPDGMMFFVKRINPSNKQALRETEDAK